MEKGSESSRWCNLPSDLILSIVSRFDLPDVVRSRGVCRHWAKVLSKDNTDLQPRQFPLLLLPSEHGEQSESCTVLSLPERRLYHLSAFPEIRNRRFMGSNGNWLVTLDLTLEPRLVNPFTREEAPLPSLITVAGFHYPTNDEDEETPILDRFIQKIVPSSHSNNGPPCFVVVVYGFKYNVRLALARRGDCVWTLVPLPFSVKDDGVSDVVHNAEDGRFYAVTKSGAVFAFHPDNPEHVLIYKGCGNPFRSTKPYLVFSSDDLLVVQRCRMRCDYDRQSGTFSKYCIDRIIKRCTCSFIVRKINMKREGGDLTFSMLTYLNHLSGRCLMLGRNHSVSFAPEQVPGLKGNCIYFTDDYFDNDCRDYKDHPQDVGVFDMNFDTVDRFLTNYSSHTWPPPIWLLSSLHMY